jgi:SAM-dependent methyltransferase
MIERLDARARAEGLSVQGRTMDGHALDLTDDAFDVAVSVNGVSLFPDMARGLAELVRVTRPGGRVVIVAFGPIKKVEFIAFVISAVRAAAPDVAPLPTDPPPLPFQAADPEVLRDRLADAGLREVRIDKITWETAFTSAHHLWRMFTASNPIGAQVGARLGDEQRAGATRVLDGMLRERSGGAPGAVLHAEVNIGIGTV